MTHVLLTRSPLSPGPKPWFSLDLHVLSAPPAFVLSQDQTHREDWLADRGRQASSFKLVLKVSPPGGCYTSREVTGYLELCDLQGAPRFRGFALRDQQSVSTFHAVEFSKTALLVV